MNHTRARLSKIPQLFKPTALLVGMSALLTACVSTIYQAPNAVQNSANQWYAERPHNGKAQLALDWWQQFHDDALLALQQSAAQNNTSLAVAQARMAQARANAGMARASQIPNINLGAQAARTNGTDGGDTVRTQTSGVLDAAWEVDLWGGVRANTHSANAQIQASEYDHISTQISVASEVASTYTAYRACAAQSGLLQKDVTSRSKTVQLTQKLVQAGFTAPAEGALSTASLANAEQALSSTQMQCDILVKNLVVLTGDAEPNVRAQLNRQHAIPYAPAFAVTSLPVNLVSQRPDVASSERRLYAAYQQISVARANRLPRLSLLGNLSIFGVKFSGQSTTSNDTWSFGPSLSLPVFDAGRLKSAEDAARGAEQEALANYRATVSNAVREVETALVALNSAQERFKQAQIAEQSFAQFLKASQARHDAGMLSLLELEDARRSLLTAQQGRINAEQDTTTQWINLYKALGGGWQVQN